MKKVSLIILTLLTVSTNLIAESSDDSILRAAQYHMTECSENSLTALMLEKQDKEASLTNEELDGIVWAINYCNSK